MKQQGFVIPLVLMLISIIIVITTSIYQKGSLFVPFAQVVTQREHAKMLALSGMQVAMSQLAMPEKFSPPKGGASVVPEATEKKDEKEKRPESAEEQAKNLLAQLLPTINQWQTYQLKKEIDGLAGTIKIAIACEEGKIDLNAIYDFAQKKFVGEGQPRGDWKKLMQYVCKRIEKRMKLSGNLFESFEKFLKERQYRVNDATELLPLNTFKPFARTIFYDPSLEKNKERPLYLLDIFTVYGSSRMQPWLISQSVQEIFDFKGGPLADKKQQEKIQSTVGTVIKLLVNKLKPIINVSKEWNDLFQPLYGIEFKQLYKGLEAFFDGSFDPKIFSVVSYGVVGEVTQRLYAILERVRHVEKDKTWYDVKVKKFYWI